MLSPSSVRRAVLTLRLQRGFAAPVCAIESNIKALGLELPAPGVPKGAFNNYTRVGDMVYLSGHFPQPKDRPLITGKVGKDLTVEDAYEAGKYCGLNLCSTLRAHLGSLEKVKKIVKITGFVNATETFVDHPKVLNGCSELMVKVFPEKVASHSRSAVGVSSLPMGVPVEIEMLVQLYPKAKKEKDKEEKNVEEPSAA